MTVEDSLARLRAGLDKDERIARAAVGTRGNTAWVADGDGDVWGVAGPLEGLHRCDQHEPGVPDECNDERIAYTDPDDMLQAAHAAHIAQFSPHHVLPLIEAIGRVIARHQPVEIGPPAIRADRGSGLHLPRPHRGGMTWPTSSR